MKPSNEVLVKLKTVAVAVAIAAVALPAAQAASPVVRLRGDAQLITRDVKTSARFHVNAAFSTDTPGADLFTIQRATIFFPDHAGTNGRLFPSCDAQQIERFHGNVNRCPKGSKIGAGTLKAKALQIGLTAGGTVAMFNSHHGKSITFNIQTILPAYINRSLDAPITQLHGRYGEKLTLVVPPSLQEILSGVFVGLQEFDVTIDAAVRVHGVDHTYLKARTCPKQKLHGIFDFVDGATGQTATTTTDTKVACEVR